MLYRTGDVAALDDDGYLTYVGRADDVFKSSDYRISPFELESALIEHPAVAEAAVVPSPDPLRLAVPKAFVALAPGHAPDRATALSIFQHCRAALAPFKRVRRLEFAELPKTISGKIRRVELRRNEAANPRGRQARRASNSGKRISPQPSFAMTGPSKTGSSKTGSSKTGSSVNALGKLLRTTAFQLTLVYLLVFALFAASLLGYFALNTRRLITEQITSTVDAEITGLSEQYTQGGIRRLVIVVDLRSRRPGSSLYLVTTPTGEGLAGNVGSLEPGMLDHPGWLETNYRRLEAPEGNDTARWCRVVQLPGGFRLLVGRDLEERERLFGIIANAGRWSFALVVVLGLAGGFFVSRRVLNRIDAMTDTAQTIMAGDLAGRLAGRGHRRRTRPSRRPPQRHAGAHRGADARPQGSLRQYRPRSQDAADAAAQSLRTGAARHRSEARIPRGAGDAPSRNPTT